MGLASHDVQVAPAPCTSGQDTVSDSLGLGTIDSGKFLSHSDNLQDLGSFPKAHSITKGPN